MEIGHNILHGQWDWMRDPKIHSTTWEWDSATPAAQWKHAHNELHHNFTNVIGKDNDLGYGIMRVDEDQPWHPMHLGQPLWNFVNALFFEYGIAAYDLEFRGAVARGKTKDPKFKAEFKAVRAKIRRQVTKDYVVHPALSMVTGSFLTTMAANFTANTVRNLWSHSVIMCGHFPEGVQTFEKRSIEGETKPEWYVRQMLGSANISGSRLMHIMTGNLSHQIEHHLFPDLPSNRYGEIAPKVKDLFDRYGLDYCARPLPAAGLLRVAQGGPAVAAQRLARPDHAAQPARPAQAALPDDHRRPEGSPCPPGPDDPGEPPPGRGRLSPAGRHTNWSLERPERMTSRVHRGHLSGRSWPSRPRRDGCCPAQSTSTYVGAGSGPVDASRASSTARPMA